MMRLVIEDFDVDAVVHEVAGKLRAQFPGLDPVEVDTVVREEVERLQESTVTDFVSVLSARAAKRRLKSAT